jgi:hypothetical protein
LVRTVVNWPPRGAEQRDGSTRRLSQENARSANALLAAASDARPHGAERDIECRCGVFVAHAPEPAPRHERPLIFRQLRKGAFNVAKLKPHRLIGQERQRSIRFLQIDAGAVACVAAQPVEMLIVKYCEQPSPQIGLRFP